MIPITSNKIPYSTFVLNTSIIKIMPYFSMSLCFLFFPNFSHSQEVIELQNPSFEDAPRMGGYYGNPEHAKRNRITNWFDCGILNFYNESAPDIHSSDTKYWNVSHDPSHGDTFLGLSARDNKTWESISQHLSKDLIIDACYEFKIDLCQSESFKSGSRLQNDAKTLFNYSEPLVLEVWLGNGYCRKEDLLFVTPPIDHNEWKTYTVSFSPKISANHLTIMAYYTSQKEDPYNGNILLDNLSDIVKMKCSDE